MALPLPPDKTDRLKSLKYFLSGALFLLVLLDKSIPQGNTQLMSFSKGISDIPTLADKGMEGFSSFRNFSPLAEKKKSSPQAKQEWDLDWEDTAEEDLLQEEIPTVSESAPRKSSSSSGIKPPQDGVANVYFLKFFGSGNKSHSRLIKVSRKWNGQNPVDFLLTELLKGPTEEEKDKGVLNSLPRGLTYSRNYRLENGILHLSLNSEFQWGAGPEILRDRLDQISFTLTDLEGIRGVKLYIDQKPVETLGGDGVRVPEVLAKTDRNVVVF